MGFELPIDAGDLGQPDAKAGRVDGSEAGAHRRLLRDGVQVLAHGAMVCPRCTLPIAVPMPLRVRAPMVCGYCEHSAAARDFLVEDTYDTVSNEVYLVARVG